jgi:sugar transferase (PEP-CTERM/EpsH1 system associated)
MSAPGSTIHVVHMVYRFAAGGLENVLVQLVNALPRDGFRHTIIALTLVDREFARRIERDDVSIIELNKPPGQPFRMYPRVFRLLRRLRPDVLHTCNLAALEFAPVAALVGVPLRVHAEHGWDIHDPEGRNRRFRLLRRVYRPFVSRFVAVSVQLQSYLRDSIGVGEGRLHLIPNGVDTQLFHPAGPEEPAPEGFPFRRPEHWVIGTVGRLEPIKNQLLLAQAFIRLIRAEPPGCERLRLAIVGGGPLAGAIAECLHGAGLSGRLWMPGARGGVASIMRQLDCFVLPSISEGTSCTLQEAMATALPIIATDVGGNAVLLEHGKCGTLVPAMDAEKLAGAILQVFLRSQAGAGGNVEGLAMVREKYALSSMVGAYQRLFSEG